MQSEETPKKVKILAMSDTHDLHFKIDIQSLPEADIFIHAGDFTKYSTHNELYRFREFLQLLPYKHKIVIAGNHDFALDRQRYESELKKTKHKHHAPQLHTEQQVQKLKKICTYLEHQMVEVEGIRIFGSPYSPEFFDWGFMYCENQSEKLWSSIPDNIDVLITHGPPYGILDATIRKEHAGCKGLLKFVEKIRPQAHIFGHIHEGYGKQTNPDGITYYNASNVDFGYRYVNPPHLIEVEVRAPKKEQ